MKNWLKNFIIAFLSIAIVAITINEVGKKRVLKEMAMIRVDAVASDLDDVTIEENEARFDYLFALTKTANTFRLKCLWFIGDVTASVIIASLLVGIDKKSKTRHRARNGNYRSKTFG